MGWSWPATSHSHPTLQQDEAKENKTDKLMGHDEGGEITVTDKAELAWGKIIYFIGG